MRRLLRAAQARKLDRVAAVYAAAGWILGQAAAILLPTFDAPVWALRVFIVLVLVGFPVALAIAWTAVPHPHAHQREVQIQTTWTDKALLALLGAVVVLSVAQFAFEVSRQQAAPPSATEASRAAPTQNEASIAVLPFENLSSDKGTGYFAAGIQDEILTRLAKIHALKVISRTSTTQYASQPENLRDIGRQLGAANILEGSVQKAGNVVRVNVQLIHAASDAHLWAEIYDRKLDDIFSVESDVAAAIAAALVAQVTPTERAAISVKPTSNRKAYDSYLKGLVYSQRNDDASRTQAIGNLEEAVRSDPNFATAWALLSREHAYVYFGSGAEADRAAASEALTQALSLAPQSPEVQLAQGFYTYYVAQDYASAFRQFHKVYVKWPNNADVIFAMAVISRRLGQWHESTAFYRQAIALNPRFFQLRAGLGVVLFLRRAFADNLKLADDTLNDFPDNQLPITWKASIFQAMGELDRADETLKDLHPDPANADLIDTMATQLFYRHRYGQGVKFMAGLLGLAESQGLQGTELAELASQLGDFQRLSGDDRAAKESYEKAISILSPLLAQRPDNAELLSYLAYNCSGLRDRAKALAAADLAVRARPLSKDALEGMAWETNRAIVLSRFGERDAAIASIARLLKIPGLLTPAVLRLDPNFDALRSDKRFEALANSKVVEN